MMHGRGKSDPGIVAVKPANNAEQSAAELVEPRTGTKGNADQQSTRRAQYRESVSQALGRIRQVSPSSTRGRSRMHKGARPDLCGGRGATRVPTATLADHTGDRGDTCYRSCRKHTGGTYDAHLRLRQARS